MPRAVLALILLAALSACAQTPEPVPRSTRLDSAVTVEWQDHRMAVERRCQQEGAPRSMTIHACAVHEAPGRCTIIAVEPAHWRDRPALERLGHELWHCLGAKHGEVY